MSKEWKIIIAITTPISLLFAVLYFPIAYDRYGFVGAWVTTWLGVIVIWVVSLFRSQLFGFRTFKRHSKSDTRQLSDKLGGIR